MLGLPKSIYIPVLLSGFVCGSIMQMNEKVEYERVYWIEIINQNVDHSYVLESKRFALICRVLKEDSEANNITLKWSHQNMTIMQQQGRWHESSDFIQNSDDNEFIERSLMISSAQIAYDSGDYECFANKNYNYVPVRIIDKDFAEIKISEETNTSKINVNLGDEVLMVVEFYGYPNPIKIVWKSPDNAEIDDSDPFFKIENEDTYSTLTIKSAQLDHNGNYTVIASNIKLRRTYIFVLTVQSRPRVQLSKNVYYLDQNGVVNISCSSTAFPAPKLTWHFKPCEVSPKWPTCKVQQAKESKWKTVNSILNHMAKVINMDKFHSASRLIFKPLQSGLMECHANNPDSLSVIKVSQIRMIDKNMEKRNQIRPRKVVEIQTLIGAGYSLHLECNALAYNYKNILWYTNGTIIETSKDVKIMFGIVKKYYYVSKLIIKIVKNSDAGKYECRAERTPDTGYDKNTFTVKVYGVPKGQPGELGSVSKVISNAIMKVFKSWMG